MHASAALSLFYIYIDNQQAGDRRDSGSWYNKSNITPKDVILVDYTCIHTEVIKKCFKCHSEEALEVVPS